MEWKDIMQVGKVSSVNNTMYFGAQKTPKRSETPVYYVQNENVLKFGLAGLAIIGVATVTNAIMKKNNHSIPELLGKLVGNISKKMASNKQDPLLRVLDGKRDANAVKIYKKYQSQAKIKSFAEKFLAGEYNNKPSNVYDYMCKNMEVLSRTVSRVI